MASDLRLAGLDLSLTSTGYAESVPMGIVVCVLKPKTTGCKRLVQVRNEVLTLAQGADLILIEGYSFGTRNHRAEAIGELGGVVRVALYEAGIPFLEVSPKEIKKYATGKGNASKEAVYGAAVHRAGREFATTDEADAWWLLQMALAHYGLPHVPMPVVNRAVLDKIAWPTLARIEAPRGVYHVGGTTI